MPTPERSAPVFDAADQEVARYRAVSSLAVLGLVAGLLSPLPILVPMLWLVPIAAAAISGLALWQIAKRAPDLAGRPLAMAGLLLGVAFFAAVMADDIVYRYCIRRQARQFAETWFDAVEQGEVYTAHHLTLSPKLRLPLEHDLVDFYRTDRNRHELKGFLNEKTTRTLFALGPAATYRYYETVGQEHADSEDAVKQTYAVTFPDEQKQPETFFITLVMERSVDSDGRKADWQLVHVDGGVRPEGW